MTRDAATIPVRNLPPDRLAALGHKAPSRKPESGPPTLTPRHRLLISYMVDGCPHESACSRAWITRPVMTEEGTGAVTRHPRPHEPLSLIEAADILRIKRRNARQLAAFPIFKAELERQLQIFREGEKAMSLHTLVTVRDDPGLGKAADRKVRMQAAMVLADMNHGGGTTVNVNVGGPQMVAGIVIDLREDDEAEVSTRTIEHEAKP